VPKINLPNSTLPMAAFVPSPLASGSEVVVTSGPGADLELGLAWEVNRSSPIDLDAQAILLDEAGNVLDAAYFNQLSALGGAVTHSGDNKTGDKEGDDEKIHIDVDALPDKVASICFVVCCFSGGTFKQATACKAELRSITGEFPEGKQRESAAVGGPLCSLRLPPLFTHVHGLCSHMYMESSR